jgi:uncharacterized repeat protein (TIGR02543 family)
LSRRTCLRLLRLALAGLISFAVVLAAAGPSSAALPRATSDRPDDHPGPQVHFVYMLPSDQADRNLDADGTLEASVNAMQAWFRSQTGGPGLRIDTSQGAPDITYLLLPRTDAEYASQPPIAASVAEELGKARLNDPNKLYAVYYEGSGAGPTPSLVLCGQGGRTSLVAIAVVLMHDNCGYDLSSSHAGVPGALEFVLLHETLHGMGLVPDCAPHSTHDGHVSDSPQDLMAARLPTGMPILDVGHDDYFQANLPGCFDLTQSRFFEGGGTAVSFSVGGTGHGHVRGQVTPPGFADVDCPPACSATFDGGQTVTMNLAAIADAGYVFVGWQGACSGTVPTCVLHATASATVTAVFGKAPPPPVRLTVSVIGSGSVLSTPSGISCPTQCTAQFAPGSKVRLRVKLQAGWRFAGWSGACKGRVPCNVRLAHAARVRATFRRS